MNWPNLLFWRQPKMKIQLLAAIGGNNPDDGDVMTIEKLNDAGADLSKPREVLHYLYLPTSDAANRLASELHDDGFTTVVRPAANAGEHTPNPWLLLAATQMTVNKESIADARRRFYVLAKESHGEYDGWETPVKP